MFTPRATKVQFTWVQLSYKSEVVLPRSCLAISEKGNAFWTPDFTHVLLFVTRRSHGCAATLSSDSKKVRVLSVTLLKFIDILVKGMSMNAFELESLLSSYNGHMLDLALRWKWKTLTIKILSKLIYSTHHPYKVLVLKSRFLSFATSQLTCYRRTSLISRRGVFSFVTSA